VRPEDLMSEGEKIIENVKEDIKNESIQESMKSRKIYESSSI